jgi:hypothetical protein
MTSNRSGNNRQSPEEEYRSYVWKYFKLHANQRIVLFRFYIIFFSLYALASAHLLITFHREPIREELISITLGIFFILITLIFWFLDTRNRNLIHHAEDYFRDHEAQFGNQHSTKAELNQFEHVCNNAKIFTNEHEKANCGHSGFRHTHCFRMLFALGILLALIFIGFSLYSLCNAHKITDYRIELTKDSTLLEDKINKHQN